MTIADVPARIAAMREDLRKLSERFNTMTARLSPASPGVSEPAAQARSYVTAASPKTSARGSLRRFLSGRQVGRVLVLLGRYVRRLAKVHAVVIRERRKPRRWFSPLGRRGT